MLEGRGVPPCSRRQNPSLKWDLKFKEGGLRFLTAEGRWRGRAPTRAVAGATCPLAGRAAALEAVPQATCAPSSRPSARNLPKAPL